MAKLVVHQDKVGDIKKMLSICPFGAMEEQDGKLVITAACKMCRMCVRKGPKGAVEYVEDAKKPSIDKTKWQGIAVYIDHTEDKIHPVSYELLGKARELAQKAHQPVYALFIGYNIEKAAEELKHYGVDKIFVCDNPALEHFRIDAYAGAFTEFIKKVQPAAILVGATTIGRQLAPRIAARFRTGLTADCTILDIKENTDLIQIRPAFGGNIMAEIMTPNNRPQMATVRYKVMDAPARSNEAEGELIKLDISPEAIKSRITVEQVTKKPKEKTIEAADVLVVAGRGIKKREDLSLLRELAELLGGEIACTRPLVEAGWLDARHQVGLSGRTVRPKLIITCGVSGAIQFVAGMNNSENIVAINSDAQAPIFKMANYALHGDIYEIVPQLIQKIKTGAKI